MSPAQPVAEVATSHGRARPTGGGDGTPRAAPHALLRMRRDGINAEAPVMGADPLLNRQIKTRIAMVVRRIDAPGQRGALIRPSSRDAMAACSAGDRASTITTLGRCMSTGNSSTRQRRKCFRRRDIDLVVRIFEGFRAQMHRAWKVAVLVCLL